MTRLAFRHEVSWTHTFAKSSQHPPNITFRSEYCSYKSTKWINFATTRGPGVVPTILRVVARTIENSLRSTDLVGCWSENQFLVVLMECKEAEVERVAHRIMKMICQSEVEWWGDTIPVTAAFGGAGNRPGDTLELLVGRAGKCLVRSLAEGGNRVTVI